MSAALMLDLHNTVVASWWRRLADNPSATRNHLQTKIIYFQSAQHLVTAHPGQPLSWKRVVAAARPRGCRSTFYEVAGRHARHGLVDDLIRDGRSGSVQLALRYLRTDAVDQLLDETKVWSFWPYRERLLAELDGVDPASARGALVRALTAWARRNPTLAATLDYTPPASAVEDLMVMAEGGIAAIRAAATLAEAARRAVDGG